MLGWNGKRWAISTGTAVAVWVCGATAMAQEAAPRTAPMKRSGARVHDGFFLRLGPSVGPLSITGKADAGGPESTISGFSLVGGELLLGGTPVDGLVVGGGWLYNQVSDPTIENELGEGTADGTMFVTSIDFFAQYYFDPGQGAHVQLMVGYGGIDFVDAEGRSGGNDPVGLNLAIGGGYDFWLGDEWSVGPFLRIQYASMSPSDTEYSYSYLFPTLGAVFTYH